MALIKNPKLKEKIDKVKSFIAEKAPQLKEVAHGILDTADNFIPALGLVTKMLEGDPKVSPEDKLAFQQLANELTIANLEAEKEEMKNVTERHKTDMLSDSWMSKNIRPYTLVFLLLLLTGLVIADSSSLKFNVDQAYTELLKYLLISVFLFYFGGRELTKIMSMKKR